MHSWALTLGKLAIMFSFFARVVFGADQDDKIKAGFSKVEDDDAEMKAAIEKARGSLKHFWETKANPKRGERGFTLKVRIKDEHGAEHIWASNVEQKDGKIFGQIDNEPQYVRSIKDGQRIEIAEADISDWLYLRGDKMIGNYTLRALFKIMPKEEVEKFKKIIADP